MLHHDRLLHRPRRHRDHPADEGISPELMQVNTNDDITRWWEVMDRTTGQPVPPELWSYADGSVTVQAVPFHEYTVSFLAYLIWDRCTCTMPPPTAGPTSSTRSPLTCASPRPQVFHGAPAQVHCGAPLCQRDPLHHLLPPVTLIFDELKREKFVDWYGYSASVSPYILNQFEQEVGYKFRPEYIIDQATTTTSTGCQQGIPRFSGIPAPGGGKACQGDGGYHPRVRLRGHDVPG